MARTRRTPVENTQPVTHEKLVRLIRAGVTSHSAAATELGVTVGQISSLKWSQALVEAGEYSEVDLTPALVKKLYDVEGNRWELIAARGDVSVNAVKDMYDEAGGEGKRGTNPKTSGRKNGENGDVEEETPKRRGRPAKAAGTAAATTGKRATAAATPRRARTRAERRAGRSNNPS